MNRNCKVLLAGLLLAALAPLAAAQKAERRKVAEGEYLMKIEDGDEQIEYRDNWTLWRIGEIYQVQSRVRMKMDEESFSFQATFQLDAEMRVRSFRASAGFAGRIPGLLPQRSLTLEVTDKEVRWSAEKQEGKMPVDQRRELFLPLPWFVNGIVRRATQSVNTPVLVPLVMIDDGADEALELIPMENTVTFLGTEEIRVAEQWVLAQKYEFESEESPGMQVYVSPEGVLLLIRDPKREQTIFELVRYKKYEDAKPGAP